MRSSGSHSSYGLVGLWAYMIEGWWGPNQRQFDYQLFRSSTLDALTPLHYILPAQQPELSFNQEKDLVLSKPTPLSDYNTHQIGAVLSNFNRTPNTRILKQDGRELKIYFHFFLSQTEMGTLCPE